MYCIAMCRWFYFLCKSSNVQTDLFWQYFIHTSSRCILWRQNGHGTELWLQRVYWGMNGQRITRCMWSLAYGNYSMLLSQALTSTICNFLNHHRCNPQVRTILLSSTPSPLIPLWVTRLMNGFHLCHWEQWLIRLLGGQQWRQQGIHWLGWP